MSRYSAYPSPRRRTFGAIGAAATHSIDRPCGHLSHYQYQTKRSSSLLHGAQSGQSIQQIRDESIVEDFGGVSMCSKWGMNLKKLFQTRSKLNMRYSCALRYSRHNHSDKRVYSFFKNQRRWPGLVSPKGYTLKP